MRPRGDDSGLSGRTQVITGVLSRGKQEIKARVGDMIVEAEVEGMRPPDKGCWHPPGAGRGKSAEPAQKLTEDSDLHNCRRESGCVV